MHRYHRAALGAGLASLISLTALTGVTGPAAGSATPPPADPGADVQPWLADQLDGLGAAAPTTVFVHGASLAAANDAVAATGMTRVSSFDRIAVVVATGTAAQVEAAGSEPGVTYLEGNQPIEFSAEAETSHLATRGLEASQTLTGPDGSPLDGSGVSVGIIDSGIDPNHPAFADEDGTSVVANLKVVCEPLTEAFCEAVEVPNSVDTDTLSVGGHGTHVSGIASGRPVELSNGDTVRGAASGSDVVSLSTGAGLVILGADTALNWVLENHAAPCGAGVSAQECPPIKVTNNSYGPVGGGEFEPQSATVKLQRALAAEGVLTVWAAGNDGGDGSESLTNPPGQDPTPGVLSVASYFDQDTGTRDGVVSDFSSRGQAGDQSTYPDLSAPGEDITSACRPYLVICATGLDPRNGPGLLDIGTYNTISGTSMAAPHITGIIAQLFEAYPGATPAQMEEALERSAHQFSDGAAYEADPSGGVTSFDKGHGLVDVVAAHALLGG